MLILTRNSGQNIMIGHDIVVKVLSNQDGRVRIGIDAPDNVKILREEILPQAARSEPKPSRGIASACSSA